MAHESTDIYLGIAETQRAGAHASLRAALRAMNTAVALMQAGVAAQRGAFGDMQLDETDPAIVGVFVEALDILKTIDRLSGEINNTLTQLPAVLDRDEAMTARIRAFITPTVPA